MRILFDHGTPAPLACFLAGHSVTRAKDSWDRLANGALIEAVEAAGFDVLLTTDKNIRYQQNLKNRSLAIVVLGNSQWPFARPYVDAVVVVVNNATSGSYAEVAVPLK